jgi:hypothetical protein
VLSQAQEAQMETARQLRQSINVTAFATLLVAVFTALMGRELNAAMLSTAGLALIAVARFAVAVPRRGRPPTRTLPALCAHL